MSGIRGHQIYHVSYRYHKAIRVQTSQDEVEFKGYETNWTFDRWVVIAPSDEVARAWGVHRCNPSVYKDGEVTMCQLIDNIDAFVEEHIW